MCWMFPFVVLAVMLFGGCNSYNLRYQAIPQPKDSHLFADFVMLQDNVTFSIDTDGERLEDIYVKKGDGTQARPVHIVHAAYYQSAALGTGIGGGARHIGGGVGVGFPIGPKQAHGLTTATFTQAATGPLPWELHVKVQHTEEAVFPGVGGAPSAR